MRYIIFLFLPITCSGQQMSLPTWLIDSMAYEVKLGRQCSKVVTAQANEIKALGSELLHTGTALELKTQEAETLKKLIENGKQGREIDQRQFALDREKMKRKIRKRTFLVIGEAVLIVVMLL